MPKKFRERIGLAESETALQVSGMSDALRNSLWNVLDEHMWSQSGFVYRPHGESAIVGLAKILWRDFFKKPVDSLPNNGFDIHRLLRRHFFESNWAEVYEFIEFILSLRIGQRIVGAINAVLERELSGYRVIEYVFVPVTDEAEVDAVQTAISDIPYAGVQAHLRQALNHLSRRESPDYRNSIKESISAVECMAREISGNPKATLGDALTTLEKSGNLHAALKRGFSALYGYTSDEGGIRHAMLDEPNIDVSDAKLFLVMCASFINYLKVKA